MKKFKYILSITLFNLLFIPTVFADPSYTFTVSSSSITSDSRVTASVTVKNTASWNIKITSAGNTNGCTNSWADASSNGKNLTKTFSVTCKANSTGSISFTLSGDITDEDFNNKSLSGTKTVKVTKPVPASTVNDLKSLTVDNYELLPEFDEDTLEYTVSVPPTTTTVNIDATKKDSKSKIEGTGEFPVEEGTNNFKVIVTSESGSTKEYTIIVNVEDTNPIKVNVNNQEYTVLKTSRNLEIPTLYIETTINIEGYDVPAFVNSTTNITLVALKDVKGDTNFYIYKDGQYYNYTEITTDNLVVYPTNKEVNLKNWVSTDININNIPVKAYKYDLLDNNYYLLYGMNLLDGQENLYLYDEVENSMQIFNSDLYNLLLDDNTFYLYFIIGAFAVIILCLIIIISLIHSKKKVRKSINILEQKLEKREKEIKMIAELKNNHKNRKKNKQNKELAKILEEVKKEDDTETYNILEDD